MPTPHIEANKEDIAKVVLMPGDPLRAKMIAEKYLKNYKVVNKVRNILAYTGEYKGKRVTVFSSGMGNPSIGIYSYELYKFYDVDKIIRIGSCGAYSDKIGLYSLILVDKSYSNSAYDDILNGENVPFANSSNELNQKILEVAKKDDFDILYGNIYCTDVFYNEIENPNMLYNKYKCLGVEMESFALFLNAKKMGKDASCILTVSDNVITHQETTSEERQNSFTKMVELALDTAIEVE
ncbi:MAG: purine-nucleoside phosphorylase [Bacilli bacterium]|nr:purine-nucleoside phosphorylase [Bacilli bacterium]